MLKSLNFSLTNERMQTFACRTTHRKLACTFNVLLVYRGTFDKARKKKLGNMYTPSNLEQQFKNYMPANLKWREHLFSCLQGQNVVFILSSSGIAIDWL